MEKFPQAQLTFTWMSDRRKSTTGVTGREFCCDVVVSEPMKLTVLSAQCASGTSLYREPVPPSVQHEPAYSQLPTSHHWPIQSALVPHWKTVPVHIAQ